MTKMPTKNRLLSLFAALCYLPFCPLGFASDPSPNRAATHEQGRAIYNYRCYFCHGYSGDARTLAATYMQPAPRDFTAPASSKLSREEMIEAVTFGKKQTAMTAFSRILDEADIATVVDFVRVEFIADRAPNTRYHKKSNGWPNHQKYAIAFPFATGQLPLDIPWEQLNPEQRDGKQLFMTSCISCHDRAVVENEGAIWSSQSLSYPRNSYSHKKIDAITSASTFAIHDRPPPVTATNAQQRLEKQLFEANCAFCHGAAGTGKNWIGSFLEPKPRDLTDQNFMSRIKREDLHAAIRNGLANSSMPAWRHVLDDNQIDAIISYIDFAFHSVSEK